MSGYLLDTRTVLWAFEGDRDLSRRAGQLIEDPANNVVISIVAYWELQIKQTIGNCARPPNTTTVSGNGSTGMFSHDWVYSGRIGTVIAPFRCTTAILSTGC